MAGRPEKHTVEYFSHDANALHRKTLTILFNNFGHEGVSAWWSLLGELASTENHCIHILSVEEIEFFAANIHFMPEKLRPILNKLAELDAIDRELYEAGIIWSQNFVDRLKPVYGSRHQQLPIKPIIPIKPPVTSDAPISLPNNSIDSEKIGISPPDNTQRKKETKGTKEKESTREKFNKFWENYPKKMSKGQAEKVFDRINPDEQLLATMLAMIERAKTSEAWTKEDGRFIPYPATWLNARGWEDEIQKGGSNGISREHTPRALPSIYTDPEAL